MATISIEGAPAGSERDAAERLAALLKPHLPKDGTLRLVVEARCPGADVQQVDILFIGIFPTGLQMRLDDGRDVTVQDIVLTIEVKELSGDRIKNSGTTLLGLYEDGWKDLTKQSDAQKIALGKTLKRRYALNVRIENIIWLVNHKGSIPDSMPFVLKGDFDGLFFLKTVIRLREPRRGDDTVSFDRTDGDVRRLEEMQRLDHFFTAKIQETKADRKRWEAVISKNIDKNLYLNEDLGTQLLIIQGLAGSGKTIHLMRIAKALHDRKRAAILLTYNHALVQDIRRLFAINGVVDGIEHGAHLSTADKFFKDLLVDWNLWDTRLPYSDRMISGKSQLLSLFRQSGDNTPETLRLQSASITADYVLIDEAQDWPDDERDLIFALFGMDHVIIADGGDQLLRRDQRCEWSQRGDKRRFINLSSGLRMGQNLSRFVKEFCLDRGMSWNQEIEYSNFPGKITMVDGPYTKSLHEEIMAKHGEDGNQPIDALFCVWDSRGSRPALIREFSEWGLDAWDGTTDEGKESFPTRYTQHRIVNYRSCRGLEGWTVVCSGLDTYLGDRYRRGLKNPPSLLMSPDEHAKQQATLSALIPLTRALNHLVIQFEGNGTFKELCRKLYEKNHEYIRWISSAT